MFLIWKITFAGGGGGFEGQLVDADVGAFKTFQVQVGGDFLAFDGTEVRVADVLPWLLAIKDVLFDFLNLEGPLQAEENGFPLDGSNIFNTGPAEESAGKETIFNGFVGADLPGAGPVVGEFVDNNGAVQDAAGAFFVQRHQRGDQADVSAGRSTGEGLFEIKSNRKCYISSSHEKKIIIIYLDVAEVASGTVTFVPFSRNKLAANAFASGSQSSSSVNVQTVTAGLQTVDDTADLDWAVDRSLLHHDFTGDVHTLDGNEGTTRTFDGPGGRPGSDTSESDDCNLKFL